MSEIVPNENRYKIVSFEGKFKVKTVNIGGSTIRLSDEIFGTEDEAREFIAKLNDGVILEPAPEVKPEFVPETPVAPESPASPEAPSSPEVKPETQDQDALQQEANPEVVPPIE